ncbi:hypothetical protein METEAL_06020 [Mesoterricola silvestris]|uniref:Gfo/Idh/MocA-like oxidoreductase N-terminal domain-containing protein n=2 Tax=Mesoterricola silvestris TaxID=2927979 RepID=A0AA48GW49_9BACT|nr:hypothetical protein METEAL_06020 [Mesoterricola silvestris]
MIANDWNLNLAVVVDLEACRTDMEAYLHGRALRPKLITIKEKQQTYDELNPEVRILMDTLVEQERIDIVIIASEPLTHVMYAKWALANGLSVLMDKPVSTHTDISTEGHLARQLVQDYEDLSTLYERARQANPRLCFAMMVQRRYQTSFNLIRDRLQDCFAQTNCPVTNIQSFHSDGQWRMPTEMVDQLYHPYMQGYGKCSHSGYHYFDIVPFLLEAAASPEKNVDNMDVYSNFVRPNDFMAQLTTADHEKLFGSENFGMYNKYSDDQFATLASKFGEVDAFCNLSFKKGRRVITVASINLCHNGFSTRDWVTAEGRDLYQGNGRVGHEAHVIQQGPFQTLHFHSYKSKENVANARQAGGKEHLEIFIFRNHKMIGGLPVEKLDLDAIQALEQPLSDMRDKAKAKVIMDFLRAHRGEVPQEELCTDFRRSRPAVRIAAAIYESAAAAFHGSNQIINAPFCLEPIAPIRKPNK